MLGGRERHPRFRRCIAVAALMWIAVTTSAVPAGAAPTDAGSWSWPVVGPIVRAFDPPDSPYGSGHRGIDIAAVVGTPVSAPAPGTVKFAGTIGGHLFVSISHGGGLESTYSWLSAVWVHKGDSVFEGMRIASTGAGAPGDPIPNLHLGAKLDGAYIDPLSLLGPLPVAGLIRLAPLGASSV